MLEPDENPRIFIGEAVQPSSDRDADIVTKINSSAKGVPDLNMVIEGAVEADLAYIPNGRQGNIGARESETELAVKHPETTSHQLLVSIPVQSTQPAKVESAVKWDISFGSTNNSANE